MAEDIVKQLSPPGSPMILVFFDPSTDTQFQGEHLSAAVQNTRGGKNLRFSTEIAVYLGKDTDRPIVAMER